MAKKEKTQKTNAMRILDRMGIHYEPVEYPVDENQLDAVHVAESVGEDPACVYKTIVMKGGSKQPLIFVVAADKEVDLKKGARFFGEKKVEPLPLKELEPLTGYIRGGCTVIGIKCHTAPVAVSQEFTDHEWIYVSGGRRGLQLRMRPADYLQATGGRLAEIS